MLFQSFLSAYFYDRDLDRHRTYDIESYFEEEIYMITNPDGDAEYVDYQPSQNVIDCLEEAIRTNLGSFTCDW